MFDHCSVLVTEKVCFTREKKQVRCFKVDFLTPLFKETTLELVGGVETPVT